ncbi:MAG: LysR substrate-binding domain-containing protein [Pseudomonadota bacterium]
MPLRRLPALGSLRAFEAAARLLSFKEAATELSVTPAAVSQQIRALEDDLQVKLFTRSARTVALTEAGHRLQPALSAAFMQIRDAIENVRPDANKPLRVESSSPILTKWLLPRLHRFAQRYPDLDVSISSVSPLSDIRTDGAEVFIRFSRVPHGDFFSHKLCDEYALPLASPSFVERLSIREPRDLLRAPLLHDTSYELFGIACHWPVWFERVGLDPSEATRGTRFDKYAADHAIDAAVNGAGIVLGRRFLARLDMINKRLVSPFGPVMALTASYYVVCKRGVETEPNVAAFINWITTEAAVGQYRATRDAEDGDTGLEIQIE